MKTHVTILEGEHPSTKEYKIENGRVPKGKVKTSYFHNSMTAEIENLADLYDAIELVRQDPNKFIIRGKGIEDEQHKIRREIFSEDNLEGHFYEDPTAWLCCDFDKYEVPAELDRCSQDAIEFLIYSILPEEFHEVSYIYQWSSSAGLEYKGVPIKEGTNVHLFFYLSRGLFNTELKQWFAPQANDGFDVSTFNTVTPIFVGNHIVKDAAIDDVIPDDHKFGIELKEQFEVQVPDEIKPPAIQTPLSAIDFEAACDMMAMLNSVGAIYKRSGGWVKLKHPKERTPGDWFVRPNSPQVIHHHVHKSKRIDKWLKDFYGIDTDFKFENSMSKEEWKLSKVIAEIRKKHNLGE